MEGKEGGGILPQRALRMERGGNEKRLNHGWTPMDTDVGSVVARRGEPGAVGRNSLFNYESREWREWGGESSGKIQGLASVSYS